MLDQRVLDKYGLEIIDNRIQVTENVTYHPGMIYINEAIICIMEGVPFSSSQSLSSSSFSVYDRDVHYFDGEWFFTASMKKTCIDELKKLYYRIGYKNVTRDRRVYDKLKGLSIRMHHDFFGTITVGSIHLAVDTRTFDEDEFYENILSQVTRDFSNPKLIEFIKKLKK